MQLDMLINGKALTEYGGMLIRDYDVQDCKPDNVYYKGRNRTSFAWLAGIIGLKKIRIEIAFFGHDRHEVLYNKSRFAAAVYGKCELYLPDGYFYTSMLKGVSSIEWIGDQGAIGTFEFEAQQHGRYEESTGKSVLCKSTIPYTDCTITATPNSTGTITLAGATITGVTAGDIIVFDGINKVITKNGTNCAASATFISFPQLIPGPNTIVSSVGDARVKVGYYPIYM